MFSKRGRKSLPLRFFTLVTIFLVAQASAHDMYLMPVRFVIEEGTLFSVGLHNGDSFPESEVSPVLERVRDLKLISAAGTVDATNVRVSGKAVQGDFRVAQPGGYIAVARTIPFAFQLGAKDFNAYLKEEGLKVAMQWRAEHHETQKPGRERYAKYAKALLTTGRNNEFHTRPAGQVLEIVPDVSPYDAKPGAPLPVRVLFKGTPAENVRVETSRAAAGMKTKTTVAGVTDKDGRVVLTGIAPGKWRIHAIVMERCAEPEVADWESSWASLTFEIP